MSEEFRHSIPDLSNINGTWLLERGRIIVYLPKAKVQSVQNVSLCRGAIMVTTYLCQSQFTTELHRETL